LENLRIVNNTDKAPQLFPHRTDLQGRNILASTVMEYITDKAYTLGEMETDTSVNSRMANGADKALTRLQMAP
jgi:hypothetical protein